MPTYEYECEACNYRFELFQAMSERPKRKCPECGKNRLNRLIGAGAGVIFKGSGFYETDYKRKDVGKIGSASDTTESKKERSSPKGETTTAKASSTADSK